MKKIITILLFIAFLISPALADTVDPIHDFQETVGFPDDIRSGYVYHTNFTFSSTHSVPILIDFSIIHPEIEYDEWDAHFVLNGTMMSFNESTPGNFTSGLTAISIGDHTLNLSFSSLGNIVPGDYDYTFNLSSTPIEVTLTSTKRRSSGSDDNIWPITTPTATAIHTVTPTPALVPTAIPDLSNPTVSPTPEPINITSAQTYITTDYRPHMMLGGMIFLLAAIITLISLGRKKKKAKAAAALKK